MLFTSLQTRSHETGIRSALYLVRIVLISAEPNEEADIYV